MTGAGVDFDAVGGLTLGADALCVAIAVVSGANWFIVRKEAKGRGTNRLVEGTRIGEGHRVLLIDDVVTTGGSILKAYDSVQATGAQVVAAVTLADRGDDARRSFDERGVLYFPMATYQDMGIPAIGTETASTA
ncbi:MAG: phosphoribosyltransferase family protein [Acidimicrobiaceae bacterium]|nr:phosphoribosyltransferase family protein [Acidimicrobiaceae bacterium]